ncbi:UNVERIFIED_CONTAM: movement protein [Sesamum latifolium]|uniref:Movement protein n=1 Tax=Sesamum latifolium TaxID=2727402 RepID=A0AAW2XWT6_9LAMI
MDLQSSQSNYNEEDRLQTSESLSGFFSRMTVSNKTMERIMRQDFNLSPYDGFRIGGIGRVLNQMGLNQRRHHIIYKVSSGEFSIPMELTGNVMEMQLIPKEEILEELRKLMFDIHPRIAYNLADQDFSRVLTLHRDFKRKDLMKEGNRPYSITYRIAYALFNTHHSDLFLRKEYIEIPKIFKEFAKQPVIGRYEGMLEIAGHEILVAGVAGKENGSMTLELNFLEDHKPLGRKDNGSGICRAKPGVFPKEAMETLPVIAGRDFSPKILILNKGIREAKIMIGGAFKTPWQQGLIESDSFYEESEKEIINLKKVLQEIKSLDISEESRLSLENVKRLIQRNFSENPLAWWDRNKIEATLKVKEEASTSTSEKISRSLTESLDAQVAGQVQRADLDIVQTTIRSSLVASTALWNALQEPIRKASPSVMTRELREHDPKHALRVQGSRPVAADSSTACTRPSPDSGDKATIESQGVQTSDDSSQPSTSGVKEGEISLRPMTGTSKASTNELISSSSAWQVYQRKWEKLISRKCVNSSKTIVETSGKYNRVWMLEGSKPEDVREWYDLGLWPQFILCHPVFWKSQSFRNGLVGRSMIRGKITPLKERRYPEVKIYFSSSRDCRKGVSPSVSFYQTTKT